MPEDIYLVGVYHGGRRNGKTLSMTADCCVAMVCGKKVWSNYPMWIDFQDETGKINHYESKIIDMPDLLEMQQRDEIRDGVVALDEWNLFCNSRRSGSLANIIFSGVVQLLGKRQLSFYLTTQDFHTLDRNIRWQTDVTVDCYDLRFKYHNLPKGRVISQSITDWSGIFTGHPIRQFGSASYRDEQYMRNTRTRLFTKAGLFHKCYDSGFEFDVLSIMTQQYKIGAEDVKNAFGDSGGFDIELYSGIHDYLQGQSVDNLSETEMVAILKENGFAGDISTISDKLKKVGFKQKKTPKGVIYEVA